MSHVPNPPAPPSEPPPQPKIGSNASERLNGGRNQDQLIGLGGRDKIYGRGSDDFLDGGTSNDRIYGGSGHDLIIGGTGNDRIYGGAGDDLIVGGRGLDALVGGRGADGFVFDTKHKYDIIKSFQRFDDLYIVASDGDFQGAKQRDIEIVHGLKYDKVYVDDDLIAKVYGFDVTMDSIFLF